MTDPPAFPDALRDRYADASVAGVGGTSVVYRARELATGLPRAVKILAVGADGLRARREVQLLAALSHPGLVAVADAGLLPDGRAWIAMDWLDGETLAARLKRAPLAVADALAAGRAVADALAYLHAAGVTHRDVKPSNVLLVGGDPARATLLDLGIARSGPDAAGLTATGVLVGTPGYMAPEQVRDPRRAGPPSDVFSLGCVLFAALAGREAFTGATVLEIVAHALYAPAPAIRSVEPGVPAALA
ncbi:MAG: protein kinase, partial [Myxococcaceae bacterium]|nr:protein kinase [Myxococcaceae bacterium]